MKQRLSGASHALITGGPVVDVTIAHHPSVTGALEEIGLVANRVRAAMLIDTGAAHSVLDHDMIHQVGLQPISTTNMRGVGGIVRDCLIYQTRLLITTRSGTVVLDTVVVGIQAFLPPGVHYRGLLGRSALHQARFIYNGDEGTFDLHRVAS